MYGGLVTDFFRMFKRTIPFNTQNETGYIPFVTLRKISEVENELLLHVIFYPASRGADEHFLMNDRKFPVYV
jgi:hypothetical protein